MTDEVDRTRRSYAAVRVAVSEPIILLPSVKKWLSTGSTVLDLSVANKFPGGLPLGRISHIYGSQSTAKTVIGMAILGSVQRQGGIAFFADVENTFDPIWAQLYGLNCVDKDIWRYGFWWEKPSGDIINQPATVEEFFDEYLERIVNLKDDRPKAIVVDSLSAMPCDLEVEEGVGPEKSASPYGTVRAKAFRKGYRTYMRRIAESNVALVLIDQTIQNVGVMFGDPETTSGGRAIYFYSSVQIHLHSAGKVKNKKEKEVGIWVRFKIAKNKVGPPYRTNKLKILWDYGIDNVESNLAFVKDNQVDVDEGDEEKEKKKKATRVSFNGQTKYMKDMVAYVEENNLEQKLDEEVYHIWKKIYEPDKRKKRSWDY